MTFVFLAAVLLAAAPPPEDVEARLRTGRSALAARQYETAKQEFTAVLRIDPTSSTAQLSLGIIALVENDPATGLRHFSKVPGDVRALIGKLDCELRLKQIAEARQTAQQLDGITAANGAASLHVGSLLASAGEYSAALPFLRRAPGAAAANALGTAEERSGNLAGAVNAFAEAVKLEPTNEDYRVDHAATLLNSGNIEAAIAAFRTGAEAFPRSARLRLGLGSSLYLIARYEAAVQALLEAVRLEPGARGFDLLGKAYESAGDLQRQIQAEFEKYIATRPSDAGAYAHYAAIVTAAGGDTTVARQALVRALELDPKLGAAHLQLGMMEQAAGNSAAAANSYERAAQLDPDNSTVQYRLADAYRKLGQSDKARAALEQYRRIKAREKR